jgi:hypothetical protein
LTGFAAEYRMVGLRLNRGARESITAVQAIAHQYRVAPPVLRVTPTVVSV